MKRIVTWVAVVLAMRWMALGEEGPPSAAPTEKKLPAAEAKASTGAAAEVQDLLAGGREALASGKWTGAVALFEKALKLDSTCAEAMFGLGTAYIELDRFAEALPFMERLAKDVPDNPMVKNNLAWIYVKAKEAAIRNPAKAIKLSRAAVLDVPADYSVWNTLAEAYYADGKYERAVRAAQSALRLSQLAGVTNDVPYRELVARCRKAAGDKGGLGGEDGE